MAGGSGLGIGYSNIDYKNQIQLGSRDFVLQENREFEKYVWQYILSYPVSYYQALHP